MGRSNRSNTRILIPTLLYDWWKSSNLISSNLLAEMTFVLLRFILFICWCVHDFASFFFFFFFFDEFSLDWKVSWSSHWTSDGIIFKRKYENEENTHKCIRLSNTHKCIRLSNCDPCWGSGQRKCTSRYYRYLLGGGVLLLEELVMALTAVAQIFI